MNIATGAMACLIPKLAELLHGEYKLQTGVKKDIEFLEREMKSMEVALRKVARVPRDQIDEQIKIWADDVRELSYEMEDVVDSFLVRVESSDLIADLNRFKGLVKKMISLFKKGKTRHRIADAIKNIKDQVQEVAARRDRYKVDDFGASSTSVTTVDPRMLALFKDQRELVGINDPRDELIKSLIEGDILDVSKSNQPLKILSIVGFGGLGKTTLAKAVYDKLQPEFVRVAFISVGQNPNPKKVFLDILRHLDENSYLKATMLDETQLVGELRRLLENKRYLVVIDDIWDIKLWEIIKCAWVDSNCGSIIITTTRILQVAEKITNHVYKHKPLSNDNSRELFLKRLYISEGKHSYDQSVEISTKILQKCGGVPLAIITVASLLANKPREDWSEVHDTIGFGHEDNIDVDFTRKILLYSYYDLPCYLRTCLLHLTIYPEDCTIMKNSLIWKWVAEGFVIHEKHGGIGLFELGERYFNELINRSMIQPIENSHEGIIYACRVHDMVLDMINSLSKEENFIVVQSSDEKKYICPKSNARRLAIQNRLINEGDPLTNTMMLQVRSFNIVMCRVETIPSLLSFHGLRVLYLEICTFTKDHQYHLEHLGKLLQLRYIKLSAGMDIMESLSEIGNLKFLQTLDLGLTEIKKLPPSVELLSQLKCLHLPAVCSTVLDRIENLPSSLEELWLYHISDKFVTDQLDKLTELRQLRMKLGSLSADLFNDVMTRIGNLHKLQVIHFSLWKGFQHHLELADHEGYVAPRRLRQLDLYVIMFIGLPAWVDPSWLPHLTHLKLNVKTVEDKDMKTLGNFPELISLRLHTKNHFTVLSIAGSCAFPKLRYLYMPVMLRFMQGAMPCLEYLSYGIGLPANDYATLKDDIDSIWSLPSLQELKVTMYRHHAKTGDIMRLAMRIKEMARFAVRMHPKGPTLKTEVRST